MLLQIIVYYIILASCYRLQ